MSELNLGNRPLADYADYELLEWMNELKTAAGGYKMRVTTARIWLAVMRQFDENAPPMTVRQVFYSLAAKRDALISKNETGYKKVCKQLVNMRRAGVLPYSFIADNTRWMRRPKTYTGLNAFFEEGAAGYRRALWQNRAEYVEVWCEKDSVAGVLYDITAEWDVPLMVTRGYSSDTFVYNAAETLREIAESKDVFLYFFGDHDPSGQNIQETTRRKLENFGARFVFETVAVTPLQIHEWNLPERPTKRTDTRARGWLGGSVELEAIPVKKLRTLTRDAIERHIDKHMCETIKKTEELERETLNTIFKNWGLVHNFMNESELS